jgi:hypothetical protein
VPARPGWFLGHVDDLPDVAGLRSVDQFFGVTPDYVELVAKFVPRDPVEHHRSLFTAFAFGDIPMDHGSSLPAADSRRAWKASAE